MKCQWDVFIRQQFRGIRSVDAGGILSSDRKRQEMAISCFLRDTKISGYQMVKELRLRIPDSQFIERVREQSHVWTALSIEPGT